MQSLVFQDFSGYARKHCQANVPSKFHQKMTSVDELLRILETPDSLEKPKDKTNKIYGAIFLASVAGVSVLGGFGATLGTLRKNNPDVFHSKAEIIHDEAVRLAMRALGRGSLYATAGCSVFFYGIWKLSGSKNFMEFRNKVGNLLPKLTK